MAKIQARNVDDALFVRIEQSAMKNERSSRARSASPWPGSTLTWNRLRTSAHRRCASAGSRKPVSVCCGFRYLAIAVQLVEPGIRIRLQHTTETGKMGLRMDTFSVRAEVEPHGR